MVTRRSAGGGSSQRAADRDQSRKTCHAGPSDELHAVFGGRWHSRAPFTFFPKHQHRRGFSSHIVLEHPPNGVLHGKTPGSPTDAGLFSPAVVPVQKLVRTRCQTLRPQR